MILWLLACASPSVSERAPANGPGVTDAADSGEAPLPDIGTTPVEPSLSAEAVADAMGLAMGRMPNPAEAFDLYQNLMTQGDEVCPGSEQVIVDTWLYGCDASTGYGYAGVTEWLTGEYDVMGQALELQGVAGDFWIDTPDGDRLEAGGNAVVLTNGSIWIGDLTGSWRYSAGSPWLAHGFSGTVAVQILPGLMVGAEGAMNVQGTHVAMHELTLPEICNGGAQGGLSLRDANGGWYRIEFEECTACGSLSFEGAAMGEACVDFTPFLERIGDWP